MKKAEAVAEATKLGIDLNREDGSPKNLKELTREIKDMASTEEPPAPEKKAKKKEKRLDGYIDEKAGTIVFTKDTAPTVNVYLNNRTYRLLSHTVMRDQQTGEHYKIVKE